VLPAGSASPRAGGDPAQGPAVAAGAGTGTPPSLQDLMLGRGQSAEQKSPTGDPLDVLSRVRAPVVPPQRLNPADIESFKALARKSMIAEGVPPDQIEARLNDAVTRTQQWMDAGMPHYVAPEPPKPPPPGFGEGFGDRWNSAITGIQDLVGANGLDPMGDAWSSTLKGLAGKSQESLLFGPAAPLVDTAGEVASFADNPAYYLGGKAADGAIALPGMMFGPELAAAGEVGEAGAAGAIARDLPGVHPPMNPLEQLLPDLRSPLSPLEAPLHDGFHPPGHVEGPAPSFAEPPRSLGGGVHPSGPLEGPAPAGPAGHSPPGLPSPPTHSEVPSPAEAHASSSHAPSGLSEPPISGGHGGSGPLEPPIPGVHGSSGVSEPPASGGHGHSGPSEPPATGWHSSEGLNHAPFDPISPHIPPSEAQWAPIGHDQPIPYHSEAPQTALDLNEAFSHHLPTAELSQRLADMSTHYIGDSPDRVVLGKWNGDNSGYIGEARSRGGIYYDTSGEVWDNLEAGLSTVDAGQLGWEVNEHFLRSQLERGVPRIDYVVDGSKFLSAEDVLENDAQSFSAREIRFLIDNASEYGYKRIGDSWIRVGGQQ
jgi:hypothetical protein